LRQRRGFRGHAGHPENERADRLARQAIAALRGEEVDEPKSEPVA